MRNTEGTSPRSLGLDTWADEEILSALWEGQASALAAVRAAQPALARAASDASRRLGDEGRLAYAGAGTSGRIAAQDGAELGPTFGWAGHRVILLLAGGVSAFVQGIEDAEDDVTVVTRDIDRHEIGPPDVLVGVAASGRTAFTVAALQHARSRGALTIGLANTAQTPVLAAAEHPVLLDTGAEVIAGSTRLAAGTAQKAALNMFSTLLMTRLGHVHDGKMVDMRLSNAKLRGRAEMMVREIAACDADVATKALAASGNHVKLAVLIASGLDAEQGRVLLARHGQVLRPALDELRAR